MRDSLHSFINQLGLGWRNLAAVPLIGFSERAEPKEAIFAHDPAMAERADALTEHYALHNLKTRCSRARWKETLAFLEWLEVFQAVDPDFCRPSPESTLRWLDAGSRNWTYAEAMYCFIRKNHPGAFRLDGIELDPNRRFANLCLRKQEAAFYIRDLPEAHYHEGSVLDWREPAEVITHFLPFVFSDPLLSWGLPLSRFEPQAILGHELSLLSPGGSLLIINQDQDEADEQECLLSAMAGQASIRFQGVGRLPDTFMKYRYPRFGWICRKL